MKNTNKYIEKINQTKLIEMICDTTAISHEEILAVLDSLKKNIYDILSSASQDRDVQIKLFNGLIIQSRYSEPKIKKNNLTGQTVIVPSRLNIFSRTTRLFEDKINR